jgi:O-antigen/teichoic acid export membrane protein
MENLRNKVYQTLRGSESFFKTDMVYMAKGNFWQMLGQTTASLMSLVLLFVFANYLPKETYGTYRYILSLAGILNIFTLTGMNQAVAQAVANGKEGVLRTSVKYQLKWNLMQLAAFWILGTYYFVNDNSHLGISFLVLGLVSPIIAALNTYSAFLDGKKNFKLNNFFSIGGTAIYVAGMIVVIMFSGETIWLIVTYSLATLGSSIIFYLSTLKIYHPPVTEDKETIKYGRELTFIGFMGPIVSQMDKIILAHFWGATALAIYALAMAIPERATSFIKSLVGIGLPKFATRTPSEINKVFYLRIFQGMAVGMVFFIGYILVAPYIFQYLIPAYLEGLVYSQILAISFIFALPNRYVSLLLTSQKLSEVIFINSLLQNSTRIILYTIMGILGGIMGLVLAFVVMSFMGMIINITVWKWRR